MVWWWWIVPAVVGLLGLVLLFKGLGALFRGRVFSGVLVGAGGAGFLAAAAIASLLALDVQTYARLSYERPVATIQTRQLGPQYFEATVIQPARGENMPAATDSSMNWPSLKRHMLNSAASGPGSPLAISSAIAQPEPGIALNPPVPQPQLT